jgi:hypothetical protein
MAWYDSPFRREELVGYFRWTNELTDSFEKKRRWLYHACHKREIRHFLRRNSLFLRSQYEVVGGQDGCRFYECVWAAIQPWHISHSHDHFGPFTIKMPMSGMAGRRFYVFNREVKGTSRYYLVQRESKKPLFGKKHRAERLDPASLFAKDGGSLIFRDRTQYELILAGPMSLKKAKFLVTDHRTCVGRKCETPITKEDVSFVLESELIAELDRLIYRFPQFKKKITLRY